MDTTEEARQAFLDFLFSRLNAAFNAFIDDADREERARWWHENLQIEMQSITMQIGSARLSGLSCTIPFFVRMLAAWIDLDRPPTGIRLHDLENCGHVPEQHTTYRYRLVQNYKLNWWAVPGQGSARLIQSWKPDVQEALTVFLAQVTPVQPASEPSTEPIPATIHEIATLTAHDVAIVLDGIRDAVSGLTETIEVSQAAVSAYQSAILEEKNNVVIVSQLRPAHQSHSFDVISLNSTSSEEVEVVGYNVGKVAHGTSSMRPIATRPISRPGVSDHATSPTVEVEANRRGTLTSDASYQLATGSMISLTSNSSDDEMNGDIEMNANGNSSESSSSSSVSPQSPEEDEDSDSMVSSGELTNTSDEEE